MRAEPVCSMPPCLSCFSDLSSLDSASDSDEEVHRSMLPQPERPRHEGAHRADGIVGGLLRLVAGGVNALAQTQEAVVNEFNELLLTSLVTSRSFHGKSNFHKTSKGFLSRATDNLRDKLPSFANLFRHSSASMSSIASTTCRSESHMDEDLQTASSSSEKEVLQGMQRMKGRELPCEP